jgi:hypothetical protein
MSRNYRVPAHHFAAYGLANPIYSAFLGAQPVDMHVEEGLQFIASPFEGDLSAQQVSGGLHVYSFHACLVSLCAHNGIMSQDGRVFAARFGQMLTAGNA